MHVFKLIAEGGVAAHMRQQLFNHLGTTANLCACGLLCLSPTLGMYPHVAPFLWREEGEPAI